MTSADKELGFRQLVALLNGGLTLVAALETCSEQSDGTVARVWKRLAEEVGGGRSLQESMRRTKRFSAYVLALVRVGEETGELATALAAAAEHLEKTRAHRAMVVNALFYPVLVTVLTGGVVWFLMAKVIPALKQFLEGQKAQLPALTLALMDASDWVVANGPICFVVSATVLAALWCVRRHPVVREWTDAAKLRVPVVGPVLRLSATATFARSMALLLDSGVTLLASLETVEGLFANARVRRRLRDARRGVIKGETLSTALSAAWEFQPMLRRMAVVGESSGDLGGSFAEVAEFHEARLAEAIRRFGMVMEPTMIVIVGTLVGFVYLAFFLAIFSLAGGK